MWPAFSPYKYGFLLPLLSIGYLFDPVRSRSYIITQSLPFIVLGVPARPIPSLMSQSRLGVHPKDIHALASIVDPAYHGRGGAEIAALVVPLGDGWLPLSLLSIPGSFKGKNQAQVEQRRWVNDGRVVTYRRPVVELVVVVGVLAQCHDVEAIGRGGSSDCADKIVTSEGFQIRPCQTP